MTVRLRKGPITFGCTKHSALRIVRLVANQSNGRQPAEPRRPLRGSFLCIVRDRALPGGTSLDYRLGDPCWVIEAASRGEKFLALTGLAGIMR